MNSSAFQVIGGLFYSYSYCENDESLWEVCICKYHGLYILYNPAVIMYLWCILYADNNNMNIPVIQLFIDKNCCFFLGDNNETNHSQNKQENGGNEPIKFTRDFRLSFLRYIYTVFIRNMHTVLILSI